MGNLITAICPSVERGDIVRSLARSVQETLPDARLIVVATGQDDGTVGWCQNQGIEVVASTEVMPFARACNLGASHAPDASWLLLVNNDIVLQPGLFEAFQEAAAAGFDIIGAKLLYPESHPKANTIQHYGKWFTLDWFPFHTLRFMPADHADAQAPKSFPDVTFACVFIKRSLWDALGGLCEDYVNGFEDDDFCLRARELGASIGVHPGVLAYHHESQTTGQDTANKEAQWRTFKSKWVDSGRIQWALGVYQGWRW